MSDDKPAFPFKPRPYQKTVFDKIMAGKYDEFKLAHRPYTVGLDMGEKSGDRGIMATAMMGHNGKVHIYYDEYSDWPNYKWYRNPIKWWKWRKMIKGLTRKLYDATWKGPK